MKTFRYSECFQSIQGEGQYAGKPSVFLRLWGCNFTCAGFSNASAPQSIVAKDIKALSDLPVITQGCDTVYAWHPDFRHLSTEATAPEICDLIETYCPTFQHPKSNQSVHLVLTGGEPMLSQTCIHDVLAQFRLRHNIPRHVTIETNGTQAPRPAVVDTLKIVHENDGEWMWSVSPKLSLSGEDSSQAIQPDCVAQYAALSDTGQLKYVVDGSEQCWDELESATQAYREAGVNWEVWIMPVGASQQQQEEIQESVCQQAIARGYNFSPRVHNWIFGNRTGT